MIPPRLSQKLFIFLFFPIPFLFYGYFCLPSIGMGDSALFIHRIGHLGISTWVNNHNITVLWGWLIEHLPLGDQAYRGNLSCVLAGALAIGIFYVALYAIHRCWLTALVSSLFLMVSHSMWWHSTVLAEYAVNAVFMATAIYLYGRLQRTGDLKYLYALFFLSGLGVFQHALLGCLLIGSLAALLWRMGRRKDNPWRILGKSALYFFIGFTPWLLTFIYEVNFYHSIVQPLSGAMGGQFKTLFFKRSLWSGFREYLFLVFMQFPSPYLFPAAIGVFYFVRSWRWTESTLGLIFTFIPIIVFEIGLNTWALFAQYLSTFIILAFWASFVVYKTIHHPIVIRSAIIRWLLALAAALSLGWTVYFYAHISRWGNDPNSFWCLRYNNAYSYNCFRSNEYLANPNKRNYHDIAEFCNLILRKLPSNAQYWDSDSRFYFQLKAYYQEAYHRRPDINVMLVNSFGLPNWGADRKAFEQSIEQAYLKNKDLFLCSTGEPFTDFLSKLPDKQKYHFKKYYLNDAHWIYKLLTVKDKDLKDNTLWKKGDLIPSDKPSLINLTLGNVDSHQGEIFWEQDMARYGPFWENDDQVLFKPYFQGAGIAFRLRFPKSLKGNMVLNVTTDSVAGAVEIWFNSVSLTSAPIDLFSRGIFVKKIVFKGVFFEKGDNVILIRVVGRNKNSSPTTVLGIDTIAITS